jgi:phage tail protein X
MKSVVSKAGDSVGLLAHLHLGRDDDETEEAIYDSNPGLAKYGPVLPSGVTVLIPDMPEAPLAKAVNIWD